MKSSPARKSPEEPDVTPQRAMSTRKPRAGVVQFDHVPPEKDHLLPIARAIAAARIKRGWTQAELASRARTHQTRISELESMRGDPRLGTVHRIASVLGLELRLTEATRSSSQN